MPPKGTEPFEGWVAVEGADSSDLLGYEFVKREVRTIVLDLAAHQPFLQAADFGPFPAATPEQPHPRLPLVPGTFRILVVH